LLGRRLLPIGGRIETVETRAPAIARGATSIIRSLFAVPPRFGPVCDRSRVDRGQVVLTAFRPVVARLRRFVARLGAVVLGVGALVAAPSASVAAPSQVLSRVVASIGHKLQLTVSLSPRTSEYLNRCSGIVAGVSHGHAHETALEAGDAGAVAETMQALATSSRVRILGRLRDGEASVNELAAAVGMEASAVSHQLRILRHLRFVVSRREGRRMIYDLHDDHVAMLLDEALAHVEHVRLGLAERGLTGAAA